MCKNNDFIKVLKRKHIQTAISDIHLEGGKIPLAELNAIDDYISGRITSEEFYRRIIKCMPAPEETPEEEAERMGLTGLAKELYPAWQKDEITTDAYVKAILKEYGVI